jgi:hypothetical protein
MLSPVTTSMFNWTAILFQTKREEEKKGRGRQRGKRRGREE